MGSADMDIAYINQNTLCSNVKFIYISSMGAKAHNVWRILQNDSEFLPNNRELYSTVKN